MRLLTLLILIILTPIAAMSETNFELDHGIGFRRGSNVEDWMDIEASRKYSNEQAAERNRIFANDGSGSVIGNSIVITTEHGSHVVVNAMQINHGNQTLEVNLNSIDNYTNVEVVDDSDYVEAEYEYDSQQEDSNTVSSGYTLNDDYYNQDSNSNDSYTASNVEIYDSYTVSDDYTNSNDRPLY